MSKFKLKPIARAILGFTFTSLGSLASGDLLASDDDEVGELSLGDLLNIDAQVWSVSRSDQKARKAPATAIVVTKKQIEQRGYRDLNDVLRDLPGIDAIENSGRFGEFYTVRGIDGNDRFLVLIDGHRINPYSGTFLSTGHSLSVYNAEQVEVVYGPASVVFGADAFSAIINIVTEQREPSGKGRFQLHLSRGEYGSTDKSVNGELALNDGEGRLSVSARFYQSDEQNLNTRDQIYAHTLDYAQPVDDRNVNLRLQWGDFEFGYFQQHFNEGNGIPQNPAIYRHTRDGIWQLTTDIWWGKYGWQVDEDTSLEFDLSFTDHQQHPDSNFPKTPPQYFTGEDETTKLSAILNHRLANDWYLVAGLEFESTDSIPPYANDEVFGTGNSVKFEGENARLIRQQLTLSQQRQAGFAQLTIPLTEQWTAFAGVRHDHSDVGDNSTNPRGGLVYEPSEDTTIKLLYGTAFQAPSLFFQYEQFHVPPTGLIMVPNTELKNQRLKSYELSWAQRLGEGYMFNGSIYYNDLSDLIVRAVSDQTVAGYNTVIQNTNIGTQTAQGVDLRFDAAISQHLTGFINYSYIDADFELNGNRLDLARISQHKVNLGLTAELYEGLTSSFSVKYVGKSNTALSNSKYPDGAGVPEYTEVSGYFSYELFSGVKLVAKARNIFDKDIEHGGLYGQSGVYAPTIYQPGMSFSLGIDGQF